MPVTIERDNTICHLMFISKEKDRFVIITIIPNLIEKIVSTGLWNGGLIERVAKGGFIDYSLFIMTSTKKDYLIITMSTLKHMKSLVYIGV